MNVNPIRFKIDSIFATKFFNDDQILWVCTSVDTFDSGIFSGINQTKATGFSG